jgi:hypothetical protein
MRELWRELTENPGLLIFLALIVLSWLGNMASAAAQKAQRRAQGRVPPRPQARPRPQPQSAPPSADDIAAELRRMMGIEEEQGLAETAVEAIEPLKRTAMTPPPPVAVEVVADHDKWAMEGPRAPRSAPAPARAPARRRGISRARRRRRDLDDPARAIVMMEILGKPLALR